MSTLPEAPSTARNTAPIMDVIGPYLSEAEALLEIASGYGEHAVHIARSYPGLVVQPSDMSDSQLEIIQARVEGADLDNLRQPLQLNAMDDWGDVRADVVLSINMIHISPWEATLGLFRNAGRVLSGSGVLLTYGPYLCADIDTAESNLDFDADLKRRNPEWGIRQLDALTEVAGNEGFALEARHDCPANNFVCVFRKGG